MSTYHFVLDRLAIGGIYSRNVVGWTAVLSVVEPCELENMDAPPLADGIAALYVPITDGEPGLAPHLDRAVSFIREYIMRGAVLVHCGAGRSRSASVVIAYLVTCGMSLPEAEALVKHRRPSACPYSGFIAEIRQHYGLDALFHTGPSHF